MRRPLLAMPMTLAIVAMALFLSPGTAHAYVDPGFLSVLHQIAYVAIFGALSAVIFKPWRLLKSRFKKFSSSKHPDEPRDPKPEENSRKEA